MSDADPELLLARESVTRVEEAIAGHQVTISRRLRHGWPTNTKRRSWRCFKQGCLTSGPSWRCSKRDLPRAEPSLRNGWKRQGSRGTSEPQAPCNRLTRGKSRAFARHADDEAAVLAWIELALQAWTPVLLRLTTLRERSRICYRSRKPIAAGLQGASWSAGSRPSNTLRCNRRATLARKSSMAFYPELQKREWERNVRVIIPPMSYDTGALDGATATNMAGHSGGPLAPPCSACGWFQTDV